MGVTQHKSSILFITLGEVCEEIRQFGRIVSNGFSHEARVSTVAFDGLGTEVCLQEVSNMVHQVSPRLLISAFARGWQESHSADFLHSLRKLPWTGPVLTVMTDPSRECIAAVQKAGGNEVCCLPIDTSSLLPKIGRLLREEPRYEKTVPCLAAPLRKLIGQSAAFRSVVEKIPIIADSDATVLITGETGTGKGMVAQAIHAVSPRRNFQCVTAQCGALPERLVENELFGHAPGAYTDAGTAQKGLVQEAEGGTLFLDEIDALPVPTQSKLLSLIQDKVFRPLGSGKALTANIRIIAASNADLELLVKEGKFRGDLYYRLNVLPLKLPRLADRRDDIPLLALHFLGKHSPKTGPARTLTPQAITLLQSQPWPGNVREFENLIERTLILSKGQEIGVEQLGMGDVNRCRQAPTLYAQAKSQVLMEFEKKFIQEALAAHNDNVSRAAAASGMDRSSFTRLVRKLKSR